MVVDFYMFGANMVDRIRSKSQGTDVVTPNDGSFWKSKLNFTEKHSQPVDFSSSDSKGCVFGFSATSRDNGLIFSTLRDQIVAKKDSKSSCGTSVINATNPITIIVGSEMERTFEVWESVISRGFEVS
jgi:hypothetical protein